MSLLRTCSWLTPTLRRETTRRSLRRCPTHQIRKPFYIIILCRQKNPALPENCASELHQVMILRFSKVGGTSCVRMVRYGRVHFSFFQSSTILCMKNWGKIILFRTTWIRFWRLFPQKKHLYSRSQLLCTLNDTFIVDFGKQWIPYVITEQGSMQRISFMLLFTDCRDNCKDELYTGAYTSYRSLDQYILIILMNFRKCLGSIRTFNAPRTQRHKESRTVVLRFLKIITPVKCVILHYDGHISCPMEGELYQRHPAGPKARQCGVSTLTNQ